MATIGKRDLLTLLIGVEEDGSTLRGSIRGITRLQKLLYLLQEEGQIIPSGDGFEFVAYKAGPYSSKLYDDLELLENLGLIKTESTAESSEAESTDINKLSFDDLIDNIPKTPDSFEERKFTLTDKGRERVRKLLREEKFKALIGEIRKIKSKFCNYSLHDLLHYVYTRHPEMTTESEIRDKVLKHRAK